MSGLDVRAFSLGPIQTNAYIVRRDPDATDAVVVDPGEEPRRLLDAAAALGVQVVGILITHCHFDHIGAVAPLAHATGAPVYCPAGERAVLADIASFTPPGFGPFEGYNADHTVSGGERLGLAGLDVRVLATPGHCPGHVTYAVLPARGTDQTGGGDTTAGEQGAMAPADGAERGVPALFSGDVLFQGSVGRVDLPGGDWAVLERSIGSLMERFPPDTVVYPGHMGATTLARERAGNPFLDGLREGSGAGAGEVGAAASGERAQASS